MPPAEGAQKWNQLINLSPLLSAVVVGWSQLRVLASSSVFLQLQALEHGSADRHKFVRLAI